MSRRVTFSQEDIKLISTALDHLHEDSIMNPRNAHPEYALASLQRMQQIKSRFVTEAVDSPRLDRVSGEPQTAPKASTK
jgi:hypothetical protein